MPHMKNKDGDLIFADDKQAGAMMAMGYERCEDPAMVEAAQEKVRLLEAKPGRHKLYKDGECVAADESQLALMKSLGYSMEAPIEKPKRESKKSRRQKIARAEKDASEYDLDGLESLEPEEDVKDV